MDLDLHTGRITHEMRLCRESLATESPMLQLNIHQATCSIRTQFPQGLWNFLGRICYSLLPYRKLQFLQYHRALLKHLAMA